MAYLGSTQASSVANPLVLLFGTQGMDQRIPGSGTTGSTIYVNNAWKNQGSTVTYQEGRAFGGNVWGYWTTDNTTAICATGYFSDAGPLGVRPGDVIMAVGLGSTGSTVAGTQVLRFMTVATISTAGGASLAGTSAGQIYGST